jgi:hypothetical protein
MPHVQHDLLVLDVQAAAPRLDHVWRQAAAAAEHAAPDARRSLVAVPGAHAERLFLQLPRVRAASAATSSRPRAGNAADPDAHVQHVWLHVC